MDMLPVERASAERLSLGSDDVTVLATSAQTGGALFAVEIRMPPGGGPPMLHRHAPGEVYYVLQGEFALYIGDRDAPDAPVRRVIATVGDVVPLAGGTPHTIRNETETDAIAFVVHAPGEVMEGFSRAAAALADPLSNRCPPSIEAVLDLAEQHGVEMLGPIPPIPSGKSERTP
jgi:mannose-6-phosphate isomerase-like protein (cupin superfamily)